MFSSDSLRLRVLRMAISSGIVGLRPTTARPATKTCDPGANTQSALPITTASSASRKTLRSPMMSPIRQIADPVAAPTMATIPRENATCSAVMLYSALIAPKSGMNDSDSASKEITTTALRIAKTMRSPIGSRAMRRSTAEADAGTEDDLAADMDAPILTGADIDPRVNTCRPGMRNTTVRKPFLSSVLTLTLAPLCVGRQRGASARKIRPASQARQALFPHHGTEVESLLPVRLQLTDRHRSALVVRLGCIGVLGLDACSPRKPPNCRFEEKAAHMGSPGVLHTLLAPRRGGPVNHIHRKCRTTRST